MDGRNRKVDMERSRIRGVEGKKRKTLHKKKDINNIDDANQITRVN